MVEVVQFEDDKFFITVSREEGLSIIETLAKQILENNCNYGRTEFGKRTEKDATYFTIGVKEEVACEIKHSVDEIWDQQDAEDAIEASADETGLK